MSKTHRTSFRPSVPEALEDRAVPSALGVSARAASSQSGTASSVQALLTQADNQINAAYSSFAAGVRQAESTLVATGGTGAPTGTAATVAAAVSQQLAALQQGLTSGVKGLISSNALGVIQSQLTGSTPGSLSSGLGRLIGAASAGTPNGSVPQSSLPLLFTAVEGTIGASHQSAIVEAYLYATGRPSGNTTSGIDLNKFTGQANTVYASFASNVYQAESTLVTPAGSTPKASTALAVVSTVNQQVGGLFRSLASLVANTPVASRASVIQGQFLGNEPGSLQSHMNSLLGASASANGSIPQSALPLLFTAVDAAISASYASTAVEGYLLTNP